MDTLDNLITGNPYSAYYKSIQSQSGMPQSISVSDTLYFSTAGLGIDENDLDLTVYPNPASGEIFISVNAKNEQIFQLKITDFQGKTLWNRQNIKFPMSLDVSGFSNGIYWLKTIDQEGEIWTKKLIIQHSK
jgi:hypothetical protein